MDFFFFLNRKSLWPWVWNHPQEPGWTLGRAVTDFSCGNTSEHTRLNHPFQLKHQLLLHRKKLEDIKLKLSWLKIFCLPTCWDYRHASPCPAHDIIFIRYKVSSNHSFHFAFPMLDSKIIFNKTAFFLHLKLSLWVPRGPLKNPQGTIFYLMKRNV